MRRAFTYQLETVTSADRAAWMDMAVTDTNANVHERCEILFANLRKAMVIDGASGRVGRILYEAGTSGAAFDHDFLRRWLVASGHDPEMTTITITESDDCACNSCPKGYGAIEGHAYHVHWKVRGRSRSIGVFGTSVGTDGWHVQRVTGLSDVIKRPHEFKLAMGWAIDDVLHEIALGERPNITNVQLEESVENRAQRITIRRMEGGLNATFKASCDPRIERIECRVTILGNVPGGETIVAGRQLRSSV